MKILNEENMHHGGLPREATTNDACRVDVSGDTITITHWSGSPLSPANFPWNGSDDQATSGRMAFCPWCDAQD